MGRNNRLPAAAEVDVGDATGGCKLFVVKMFQRALMDALDIGDPGKHHTRDGKRWLMSRSMKTWSAQWWAEQADLEYELCCCRRAILDEGWNRYTKSSFVVFRCTK